MLLSRQMWCSLSDRWRAMWIRCRGSLLEKPPGATPRFFYFQYRPMMRVEATLPDVIHSAVSKLKGKTVIIHSPGDFAKGIEQVERLQ